MDGREIITKEMKEEVERLREKFGTINGEKGESYIDEIVRRERE